MGNSCVFSYDTSALKRKQVVIAGDVKSNPDPVSSVEGYFYSFIPEEVMYIVIWFYDSFIAVNG